MVREQPEAAMSTPAAHAETYDVLDRFELRDPRITSLRELGVLTTALACALKPQLDVELSELRVSAAELPDGSGVVLDYACCDMPLERAKAISQPFLALNMTAVLSDMYSVLWSSGHLTSRSSDLFKDAPLAVALLRDIRQAIADSDEPFGPPCPLQGEPSLNTSFSGGPGAAQ